MMSNFAIFINKFNYFKVNYIDILYLKTMVS
jgi:hypothetical protein